MTDEHEHEDDEKTNADAEGQSHEDWEGEDRTEVDANPPSDRHPELAKPHPQ